MALTATSEVREIAPNGQLLNSVKLSGTPFSSAFLDNGDCLVACGDAHCFVQLNLETNPNYGVYKFKKGFNGEVVTYEGEFFYIFKPFMKKVVDFCEKIVMDRHERKRQKLLKNRNKDMQ